jgi:Type II CAAX prenyl endopeptidase Rce1-like
MLTTGGDSQEHGRSPAADSGDPGRPRRDRLTLAAWFLAGLAGLACFVSLHDQSHPEASIDIAVGRQEALRIAGEFLQEQGLSTEGFRHTTQFSADSTAKNYLEKSLSLSEANRLMRDEISVFGWYCRWFKPQEEEELWVELAPDGQVIGFWHEIAEAADGASISSDEALAVAREFLATVPHIDFAAYQLLERDEDELPNRKDHHFTWERQEFKAADATSRLSATVHGDSVGSFSQWLKTPEAWHRDETRKAAQRRTLGWVAWIGELLLYLAAGIILLLKFRAHQIRFGFGFVLVATLAILSMIEWANWWPVRWMGYDTTDSIPAFLGHSLLGALVGIIDTGFKVLLVALPAEALARQVFPDKVPLSQMFSRVFWRSREVYLGVLIGCCLAMVHAAYMTLFYIGGKHIGVWSPQAWPYWNILATPMPWIQPLITGLFAAVNEEFMFRLFAIALLVRLTKRPWLAVLLPAMVWGFLHSGYPQEPIYTRGVELTIVGVVYGIVFLKYGFAAPFIAHYTYNAVLAGMLLLRSDAPYLRGSGIAVLALIAVPLAPGLIQVLRRKKLATTDEVFAAMPPPRQRSFRKEPDPSRTYRPYQPLSRRRCAALAVCGLFAAVLWATLRESEEPFVAVSADRSQARAATDAYLTARGVDIDRFRAVTRFNKRLAGDEFDYLYEQVGVEGFEARCRERFAGRAGWHTRYFIPYQKEAYRVRILPDGTVFSHSHALPEDAPGANLSLEDAQALAEEHLRSRGINLDDYTLVSHNTNKRENRTDHTFRWEDQTEAIGDGHWRIYLQVTGDEVQQFWPYLDVPEAWGRDRAEQTIKDVIIAAVGVMVGLALLVAVTWLAVRYFVRRAFDYRAAVALGTVGAVFLIPNMVNDLETMWASYNTATSPTLFLFLQAAQSMFALVSFLFVAVGSLAIIEALFRRALPGVHPLMHWFGRRWRLDGDDPDSPAARRLPLRRVWGEALLIACVAAPMLTGMDGLSLSRAQEAIDARLGTHARNVLDDDVAPVLVVLGGYDSSCPAVELVVKTLLAIGVAVVALMAIVAIYRNLFKRRLWPLLLLVLGLSVIAAATTADAADQFGVYLLLNFLEVLMVGALVWVVVRVLLRDNLPAYLLTGIIMGLLVEGMELAAVPNHFESMNGLAVLGLVATMPFLAAALLLSAGKTPVLLPQPPPHPDAAPQAADEGDSAMGVNDDSAETAEPREDDVPEERTT